VIKKPSVAGSPTCLTLHCNKDVGVLRRVDRDNHVSKHGIYHREGNGCDILVGKEGRNNKFNGKARQPLKVAC
jgi:hypothetical protein